jgi:hypothetical protein
MKLKKRWLSAALAIQVVVAAFLMWRADSPMAASGQEPLLDFSWEEVDRILLDDGETQLTMVNHDQQWRLHSDTGLPVDTDKMDRLMTEISDFKPGIPVITQQSSFARFEVADDTFYRHVQLYQGDQAVAAFYVGTTPAMNQSYIRLDDGEEVYALAFNRYQLSMGTNGWLDKGLLKADTMTAVEHENWRAEKIDDEWRLTQLNGESLETESAPEALTSLVDSLEQMRVTGEASDINKDDLELRDSYSVIGDQRWVYEFYQSENEKFVTRDDIDAVFKLTNHVFEQVAGVDFSDVLVADQEQESDQANDQVNNDQLPDEEQVSDEEQEDEPVESSEGG